MKLVITAVLVSVVLCVTGEILSSGHVSAVTTLPEQCTSPWTLTLVEEWRMRYVPYVSGRYRHGIDRNILDGANVWFRFSGAAGQRLKNRCGRDNECGYDIGGSRGRPLKSANFGYWSNGTMPSGVGDTVGILIYQGCDMSAYTTFRGNVTRCGHGPGDLVYLFHDDMRNSNGYICGM